MSQPYESYKPSGIEWLGDIPSHWEVKKLKHLATIVNGSTPDSDKSEFWDGDIVWLTPVDLGKLEGTYAFNSQRRITEMGFKSCGTTLVPAKSIVLTTRAPIGNVCITAVDACTNQGCKSLLLWDSDVKYRYFQLLAFRKYLEALGSGSTFKELSTNVFKEFTLPTPPLAEQLAIATYLDRKTAQIDDLVARKEKLLALLQQKRQAIINEAVTRGLDANAGAPDRPKKDSGIEWLGEIPAHWEVKKLKYIASLKSGETITAETIDDEGEYPVYGGGGFRGYTSNFTHEGHYSLIGRQGALCGNINYAQGKFWASEHALVVSLLGEYETVWLGELLRSMNLNQYSQSSAQPGISADRIQNLHIPVPPLNEQRDIVEFILTKGKKIDQVITDTKTQLAYFKTYRQSLISEVVAGKVDVRSKVTADEQV